MGCNIMEKKGKTNIFFIIVILILIAIIIFLFLKLNTMTKETTITENSQSKQIEENTQNDSNMINQNVNLNKNSQIEQHTAITKYIHNAQSGCILVHPSTESESVQYKYKCDYCGNVSNSTYSCYPLNYGGTYKGSYTCSNCKKSNTAIITTIKQ